MERGVLNAVEACLGTSRDQVAAMQNSEEFQRVLSAFSDRSESILGAVKQLAVLPWPSADRIHQMNGSLRLVLPSCCLLALYMSQEEIQQNAQHSSRNRRADTL